MFARWVRPSPAADGDISVHPVGKRLGRLAFDGLRIERVSRIDALHSVQVDAHLKVTEIACMFQLLDVVGRLALPATARRQLPASQACS